jgi:hypothetical protein
VLLRHEENATKMSKKAAIVLIKSVLGYTTNVILSILLRNNYAKNKAVPNGTA